MRLDAVAHKGHRASAASDLTARISESIESLTPSNTKPLGTSDEIRKPVRMALILHLRTTVARQTSSEMSQTPLWMPIGGPNPMPIDNEYPQNAFRHRSTLLFGDAL